MYLFNLSKSTTVSQIRIAVLLFVFQCILFSCQEERGDLQKDVEKERLHYPVNSCLDWMFYPDIVQFEEAFFALHSDSLPEDKGWELVPQVTKGEGKLLYNKRGGFYVLLPMIKDSLEIKVYVKDYSNGQLTFLESHYIPIDSNKVYKEEWASLPNGENPKNLGFVEQATFVNSRKYILEGKPAPDFQLKNLKGEIQSLLDFENRIVFMNFWFYGCRGCMIEMPALKRLAKKYQDNPQISFLSFALDDSTQIANHIAKNRLKNFVSDDDPTQLVFTTFPSANDIAKKYNAIRFPTNVIIDKDGNVYDVTIGGSTNADEHFSDLFDELLLNKDPEI